MPESAESPYQSLDTGSDDQREKKVGINSLTKTFDNGSIIACQDINLDIYSDEFVVLLGPSGCGKTTLLRSISGLETPDEGSVIISGRDMTNVDPKDRNLAFVFQEITLFPTMTVRDNIKFGLDMKTDIPAKEKENKVREASEMLGISDMLDRNPEELSGGQQQRVSLGRAMVMDPDAFLLDEPFSALDANLRDQLQTEIKKLHRKLDTSMIFVTHDQDEAMSLGDKIVVMNQGHTEQVGTPYEIYSQPATLFVAQFIGSPTINLFDCYVRSDGDEIVLDAGDFEVTVAADTYRSLDQFAGEEVTVGIRPEKIKNEDPELFNAKVTITEPHGSSEVAYLEESNLEIRMETEQGLLEENQTVGVSFDPKDIIIFDPNGERVD